LSLPDDWIIYKSQIQSRYRESLSKHKFDNAWKGLREKKYINGTKEKGTNGKFNSWKYEVIENPTTDILDSEMSEIREVKNPTSPIIVDIQNTNEQSTNKQNTYLESTDTSIILEENKIIPIKIDNKRLSNNEIARNLNFEGLEKLLKNSGLNWLEDITSIPFEEFISKYNSYSGDSDDYRLRFLVNSYLKLNKK
jgi:enoyl reductase-like protein